MEPSELLAQSITIPPGWQSAWLARTSVPEQLATIILGIGPMLVHTTYEIFFLGYIISRLSPSDNRETLAADDNLERSIEYLRKAERAHSYLFKAWVVSMAVLSTVDLAIILGALGDSLQRQPQLWASSVAYDLLVYLAYHLAVLSAAFAILPLLLSIAVTGLAAEPGKDDATALCEELKPNGLVHLDHVAKMAYFASATGYGFIPLNTPATWLSYITALSLGGAVSCRTVSWAAKHRRRRLKALRLQKRTCAGCIKLYWDAILAVCGTESEGYLRVPVWKFRASIEAEKEARKIAQNEKSEQSETCCTTVDA